MLFPICAGIVGGGFSRRALADRRTAQIDALLPELPATASLRERPREDVALQGHAILRDRGIAAGGIPGREVYHHRHAIPTVPVRRLACEPVCAGVEGPFARHCQGRSCGQGLRPAGGGMV